MELSASPCFVEINVFLNEDVFLDTDEMKFRGYGREAAEKNTSSDGSISVTGCVIIIH
jgi:hypothetical protein